MYSPLSQVDCEPDQDLVPTTDPDTVSTQTNVYEVDTNGLDTLPEVIANECDNCTDLTFSTKGFHLSNLNIRHIVPKIDELRILMANQSCPDVIGLCETFLTCNISDNQIAIDGFDFIRKDRSDTQNKNGGGIILYFRKSLNCKRRRELEISEIETLWAEIALPNSKPFLICSVYRPPCASSAWIDLFEEELSIAQTTGLEMILMGDFNIDLRSCTNHKWRNLLQLFDLSQLVTEPTRVTQTSSSLIDHVYSSNPENISECFVPFYSISDHFPVCLTRKISCKVTKSEHTTSSYRCFKNFNEAMFLSDLSNDLSRFSPNNSDIDTDFMVWHSLILKQLDSHAPIKTKRVKSKRLPNWFTPEISQSRKMRDHCKRMKKWADYKRYRNKTKDLIRKAKRKHFSESVINSRDTRTIWQHFRTVNNKSNTSNSNLPEELIINNERITTSLDIASKLNNYFSSISELLNGNEIHTSPLDVTELKRFINSKIPGEVHFYIPPITNEQVASFIHTLDTSKATGLDGIGPRIIKMAIHSICPSIAALINKSLRIGKFPCQLKLAKVFPIFKGGCKSDPSNYRPISILPTISKIFEKHINKHLMAYLNKYKLIHESQSGFRQKHSCQTALVKLIDHWMTCIDNGDIIGTLFLDFRKAFDLVNHSILIQKLSLYKFSGSALQWFISYLDSRQQAIDNGQGLSEFSKLQSGVPQGSILGPTLFLMFINDLPLNMKYCEADLFADDTTVYTHSSNTNVIETKLQNDFHAANTWCLQNKMQINYDKTTCMTIGTRKKVDNSNVLTLQLNNTCIANVKKQKLLGIYIDENLTWTAHIDYLCTVISSKISLLRQLSTYVPVDIQKLFYQGYILPLLDYGSITWGSTSSTNIDRLLKLQKRAARIILRAEYTTPSATMFQQLEWQRIDTRLNYNKAILTYKALNSLTPEYISNLLKPTSQTHTLSLRSTANGTLSIPRSRTKLFDGSFSCSAPKLWNSLPQSIKMSPSLNVFKKTVKQYT